MTGRRIGEEVLQVAGLRVVARGERGVGTVLVDDVGFALRRGEVIGLIGESGRGSRRSGLRSWAIRGRAARSRAGASCSRAATSAR